MPFIVNDLGKYVDDKYKNRTMINEMKAFYNFEDRIRRIHITKRKAVNVPTHVPTNTPKNLLYPNDSCTCGSGKKYKKCCGRHDM